jgi:hypothetical protein
LQGEHGKNTFGKEMGLNVWSIILKPSIKLFWNMERKICPSHVNHMFQIFLTISLLMPILAFKDSTLELEITIK